MSKLKKGLGVFMIGSVFAGLFCFMAMDSDLITAIKVFGTGLAIVVWLGVAVVLTTE